MGDLGHTHPQRPRGLYPRLLPQVLSAAAADARDPMPRQRESCQCPRMSIPTPRKSLLMQHHVCGRQSRCPRVPPKDWTVTAYSAVSLQPGPTLRASEDFSLSASRQPLQCLAHRDNRSVSSVKPRKGSERLQSHCMCPSTASDVSSFLLPG